MILIASHVVDPNASPYGYTPSRAVALVFLVLFGISTVTHFVQAIRYRMWFLFFTVCFCGLIELTGWAGRLWSSYNVLKSAPFSIEITCTIIAPTPLLAANFVVLGRIIRRLGPQYSRFKPRRYTAIFTSADVISLLVQGLGGGVASGAKTNAVASTGGNIILAGIIFQLVIIIIYSALAVEFYVLYSKHSALPSRIKEAADGGQTWPHEALTPNIMLMGLALSCSTLLLFIRAIYRVAELADGWQGPIMSNQVAFNILDGAMVLLAMYLINYAHPGRLLAQDQTESVMLEERS